ncbi:putative zinc protease [bacterium HR29]|jgi:zinc protease|nr:putative zinc protease [bacterium HR29]
MSIAAPAQTDDALPFPIREETLANGLRVIVIPTGLPNLVSLQISVRTGSRNEVEPGKSGFAHFFEHMMFRGTKRYPPEVYHAIVTRTGARQNAYTTDDYTNYHATFAAEDLETFLEIEADRFMNLSYSEEAFRIEAKAILGEYNKNASEPLVKLFEVQRDTAFDVHPYKHTTMGFLRDIEAMPEQFEYSLLFFERWYRPENTTIVVAGDVDPDGVIALVERHWGGWRRGSHTVEIPQEPPPRGPRTAHVPWPAPTLPWVTIAFRGPAFSADAPDYVAIDAALDLAFGPTSDLYRELVDELQVADQLFPWFTPHVDPALATVLARLKRPEDAAFVRRRILDTLAELRERPVPGDRLESAKEHNRNALLRTFDNSESVAAFVARFAHFERSAQTVNRLYRTLQRLTPEDVLAAARRFITDPSLVQTTLSFEPLPAEVLEPPALPSGRETGSLGRPVILVRSGVPLVHLKLAFTTGSADDPPGREGLAQLTASLLAEGGSRRHTIDEIRRQLFPLGGSLTAQVDKELTTFSIAAPRGTIDRTLDIVLPQLLEPGWRENDFARLREHQKNALVQDLRSNNDEELGKEVLQERAFAGTPYRHPPLGTVAGLDAITLDDAKAFAAESLGKARLVVGAGGDLPDAVLQRIERELGRLEEGAPPIQRNIAGRMPAGLEVTIVRKPTRATAISLGHPIGVLRGHPDFAALWLARAWLGEHRAQQGRLFQRMRELRGLNYGDYAYIEAFPRGMFQFFPDPNVARRAQLFEIWIRPVLPDHAVFALKLALFEVQRLLERGLTEEEFEETRTYLKKNAYLMTKTVGHQVGYAIDSWWYGIPDYVEYIRRELDKLTPQRVNDAVRRHLRPSDYHVVFVTEDADTLRQELLAGAPRPITYQSPPPAEVLAEDALVAELPLGLTPERVTIVPVDEVFAR